MTIEKKLQIETQLREDARKTHGSDYPAADFWWHQCRHIYGDGDIKIEVRIGLFLYDGKEPRLKGKHASSKTPHMVDQASQGRRVGRFPQISS
jgi:hypothetical protein